MPQQTVKNLCAFPQTAWTQILQSQGADRLSAAHAIERLMEHYWPPVVRFLQRKGLNTDEAEDLAQDFFTHFLEKDIVRYADRSRGRFRNFLMAASSRFLALQRRKASSRPNCTVGVNSSGNDDTPAAIIEPEDTCTPEVAFTRNWAEQLVNLCLTRLKGQSIAEGKEIHYEILRCRIIEHPPEPAASLAERLNVSLTDVANYQRRMIKLLREEIRAELRNWVSSESEIDAELHYLIDVFN